MVEVVGIRYRRAGKIYHFDPMGMSLPLGTKVIVETVRGLEMGFVVISNRMVEENERFMPLSPVVRIATDDDIRQDAENREKEKAAVPIFNEKVAKNELDMHLVSVEYTFDGTKIIFSFTAEGRVDFRELVKDLASVFRTRIELRQIGVRDETKVLGGLGTCGRPVCCSEFLGEFAPVSIKMAKDQCLSANPQKISGTCGKLICCLNYEEKFYEEAGKKLPRVGNTVKTQKGVGTVSDVNFFQEILTVRFESDGEVSFAKFPAADVSVIRRNASDPSAEENESEEE